MYHISVGVPRSCAMSPGVEDLSWSTETQCPGFVMSNDLGYLFAGVLVLQGFLVALPNKHVVHNGICQFASFWEGCLIEPLS